MVTAISPSVFLSKCESRLRDERASKDPEDMSFAHAVSGNSLHNCVLENLFFYKEIGGVGRTPWRSMANDTVSGSFDSHSPFASSRVVLAQEDRGILIQPTETLPISEKCFLFAIRTAAVFDEAAVFQFSILAMMAICLSLSFVRHSQFRKPVA